MAEVTLVVNTYLLNLRLLNLEKRVVEPGLPELGLLHTIPMSNVDLIVVVPRCVWHPSAPQALHHLLL